MPGGGGALAGGGGGVCGGFGWLGMAGRWWCLTDLIGIRTFHSVFINYYFCFLSLHKNRPLNYLMFVKFLLTRLKPSHQ